MKRRPPDFVGFLIVTALGASFVGATASGAFAHSGSAPMPCWGDPEEYLRDGGDLHGTPAVLNDGANARSQNPIRVPAAEATVTAPTSHPADAPIVTDLSILERWMGPWMRLLVLPR